MDITTRPTMEDLRQYVVPLVVTRWDDIGLALGLDCETVRSNYKQDTAKCCEGVFSKWLETSDSASWDQLIKAVKSVKLDKIAEEMQLLLQWKNATISRNCATSGMPISCVIRNMVQHIL